MYFLRKLCPYLTACSALLSPIQAGTQQAHSDLTVDDLVAGALAANPELTLYREEIDAARGGRWQAGRWANPEFTLEVGQKRVRDWAGGTSAEGLAWAASIAQPIEFPGRLALRKAIADRDIELAQLGVEHFQRVIENRVRTLAYALYATHTALNAADTVAYQTRELAEAVLSREPGGISPLLESRILQNSHLQLQHRHREAQVAYQQVLIELNQLRNVPPDTPLRLSEPELKLPAAPPNTSLVHRAWRHAFEARARQVELEQQGFRLRLSENERYPAVTLIPFFSQENAADRETVAGLGISVPLPIWDQNTGNIQTSRARLRQAEAATHVMRRELERRVIALALNYTASRDALLALDPGLLDSLHEASQLADRHYRLGAIPVGTYLEVQAAYLDTLDTLLTLRRQAYEAQLELELLTGPFPPNNAP